MKHYFVRLSRTKVLMFYGFIKEEDTFISLIEKHSRGDIKMYECHEQHA